MKEIRIQTKKIGPNHPPFIIAEMSGNHNQSLDRALKIVEAAAAAGVHALKIQTYTADTMTLNIDQGEFFISDPNSLWQGKSLYELYQEAYTPWEWHKPIFDRCRELGIIGFSSPFDASAVDFLEELGVPCYKIASYENIDIPLIRKVALTGKPVIISTGMATLSEIDETIRIVRETGCNKVILLKCTSSYPTKPKNSNILTIPHMKDIFQCPIGLSDHTLGIGTSIASVALGAAMIEKHFTLSRADGGVDAAFSLEPAEMKQLVRETKQAWESLGSIYYGPTEEEKKARERRRSLYVVKDIEAGEPFSEENIKAIRPGLGLLPKYYDVFVGKTSKSKIKAGTPLSWELL